MDKVLPIGWVETELGNFAYLKNGYAYKTTQFKDSGIPILKISNITKDGKVDISNPQYVDESLINEAFLVSSGDIVIAMSGATTGKFGVYYSSELLLQNQRVGNIKLQNDNLGNKKFLFYLIASLRKEIEDRAYGGAQPNISPTLIETIKVFLPPLREQERIVAKLDKLFTQHEKIKKALDRIPQLIKAFRQQVLTQAVTGKLTENWREGKVLSVTFGKHSTSLRAWKFPSPNEWIVTALGDVVDIKSNLVDPSSYSEYFLIAPDNIESHTGKLINKPLVSEIKPKSGKHLFDEGVIIYSKIRPYLNKLIISDFKGLCSADMYPIANTVYIETEFIFYYMLSKEFLSYSTTAGERSVLPKINQKGLNEIPIPLPSSEEQREIVRRIESLFSKADAVEARYQALKAKIDNIPQTILHKAFKGELVPQLPTDGDAKELLDEILALKEGAMGKKKKN